MAVDYKLPLMAVKRLRDMAKKKMDRARNQGNKVELAIHHNVYQAYDNCINIWERRNEL